MVRGGKRGQELEPTNLTERLDTIVQQADRLALLGTDVMEAMTAARAIRSPHVGDEALELLDRVHPSVVVLDLMLPRMDGVQFVEDLERRGRRVGLAIVAPSTDTEARRKARTIRAERRVEKPFPVERLGEEADKFAERGFCYHRSGLREGVCPRFGAGSVCLSAEPDREFISSLEDYMPDREPMADWEKHYWPRHAGTWTSHYTIRDVDGTILDEHDAICDMAVDLENNRYAQRNTYIRGDAREVRHYTAHWEGRDMVIRGAKLAGTARAVDDRAMLLNFSTLDGKTETFETIILMSDTVRVRTMQHIQDGKLRSVTVVRDEVRIKPDPDIDATGASISG
ncbi:MAG: response regulator [Dehalococcoidia bacterium]